MPKPTHMHNERQGPTTDVQLGLLRNLTSRLLSAVEIDDVMRVIAECTMTALSYEDCVVYLRADADRLVQRGAYGPKSPEGMQILDPIELRLGEGIVGAAAASAQPILVRDTLDDPRYVVDDIARRSEVAVPIIDDGEVIGVIDSEHSEANFYTDEDLQIIVDIASIAGARLRSAMTTENLNETIRDLETARSALENLSKTDDLTGLGNRRLFEIELAAAIEADAEFSICVLDLDKFKLVNDTHGHHEGDAVLRQLSSIICDNVDTDHVTVARLGGDEFGLMQVDVDLTSFDRMIENVLLAVRRAPWSANAALLDVTSSAQVVRYVQSDPRSLALREDRLWAQHIRDAISANRFSLVGQPIVSSDDPHAPVQFMEVLLRYHASDNSVLAPGRFLDSAARFGLMDQIDVWVISELRSHRVDPSRLVLEVTEHAAIEDADRFKEALASARAEGMRVAIDDLGSGWTSLAVIKENPVDIIKVDGTWVRQATTDKVSHTVARSIIECGQLLGCQVVAEWVEDDETLELMHTMGSDFVQGYLLGVPVPLEKLVVGPDGVSVGLDA